MINFIPLKAESLLHTSVVNDKWVDKMDFSKNTMKMGENHKIWPMGGGCMECGDEEAVFRRRTRRFFAGRNVTPPVTVTQKRRIRLNTGSIAALHIRNNRQPKK